MQLNEIQIDRLDKFLLKVWTDVLEFKKQFFLADNYVGFYDEYTELTRFLYQLDTNDVELRSSISSFPKLPRPDSVLGFTTLQAAYFILLFNPLLGWFFFILLFPVSFPLLVIVVLWTRHVRSRLEQIKTASEKTRNLIQVSSGKIEFKTLEQ